MLYKEASHPQQSGVSSFIKQEFRDAIIIHSLVHLTKAVVVCIF